MWHEPCSSSSSSSNDDDDDDDERYAREPRYRNIIPDRIEFVWFGCACQPSDPLPREAGRHYYRYNDNKGPLPMKLIILFKAIAPCEFQFLKLGFGDLFVGACGSAVVPSAYYCCCYYYSASDSSVKSLPPQVKVLSCRIFRRIIHSRHLRGIPA
jgi:hypothetical protein